MFVAVAGLKVPEEHQEALADRFQRRSGLVDGHDGFRRLRLLAGKRTDGFLLLLEWDDQAAFKAYMNHPDFEHAHGDLEDQVDAMPLRQYEVLLDSERGD